MSALKKIYILIFIICILFTNVYAADISYELLSHDIRLDRFGDNDDEVYSLNGIYYKNKRRSYGGLVDSTIYTYPYDAEIEKRLCNACSLGSNDSEINIDYIDSGNTYIVINNKLPMNPIDVFPYTYVYFCDKDFNLIYKEDFGGHVWVYDIGYYNGTYYCRYMELLNKVLDENGNMKFERETYGYKTYNTAIHHDVIMKSTDMLNWSETYESVPKGNGTSIFQNGKISRDSFEPFYDVAYEVKVGEYINNFGKYMVYKSNDRLYFSNDGIYFVPVLPADRKASNYMSSMKKINLYVNDNSVIINDAISIPINELIQELESYKTMYVQLHNTILSMEQPPIVEHDRTLVPMRFLFEQMGADVEWDGSVQAATATLNDTAVTFAINDTEAEVNSTSVSMDVPARLINGKTMVPLRFLSEELGYTVTWDEETRTAIIE